jgi:feruloyl-CoA synthase
LQQITQTLPLMAQDPLFVDWLPWSHTFGGNHNTGLTLFNGGSLYIDDGRATPQGIEKTVANLRELAPSVYFNVPKGFEELIPWLLKDKALRETFFSRLKLLFYAGAGMAQPVWDALEELATQTVGERIPIITGLGMTESGPSAMFAHWPGGFSGLLGVPVAGLELKLIPSEDKLEARYRGPNITPGYWRQPEATAAAFDGEGFFRTGDALKFVDTRHPNKGMLFDGRVAEDFKLTTGTWVNVGILRANLVAKGAPIVQDAVITGHNRDFVGAILFLNIGQCRALIAGTGTLSDAEVLAHPRVRQAVQESLIELSRESTGSSNRIVRVLIAEVPPSIDLGEITDKGSLNQRNVLKHRPNLVEELYAEEPSERVIW